jgi:hypothetical protein
MAAVVTVILLEVYIMEQPDLVVVVVDQAVLVD